MIKQNKGIYQNTETTERIFIIWLLLITQLIFQRLLDNNGMSKNTNFLKKANPLAVIINKQTHNPQRSKTNIASVLSNNSEQDINTKLYTFCQSQNKITNKNDENKPDNRERKISLNNNIKTQNQTKSISKLGQMIIVNRDKKAKNNMSLANINASFDRRKTEKSSTARFQDKKVNISISINPRTMREIQNSQQKYEQSQRRASGKQDKNWWELKRQQKKQSNILLRQKQSIMLEQKRKIVIEEQQLQKFTKKFAHQKCLLEQKISSYEAKLSQWQQSKKQYQTQRKDMSEYIMYLQQQKSKWHEEISTLKSLINSLKNDSEYYLLAKDQARKVIKQQEAQISALYGQVQELKQQLKSSRLDKFSEGDRRADFHQHFKNKLALLLIENGHLFNEKMILQRENSLLLNNQTSMHQRRTNLQDKLAILIERNNQIKSDLKEALLGRIAAEVYTETIQDLSESIVKLKEQNRSLKNRWEADAYSIHQPSESSRFQFKLQSTSRKKEQNSPSQVEFVWRRQNTQQNGRDLNQQQIALFEVGLFPKNQKNYAIKSSAKDLDF